MRMQNNVRVSAFLATQFVNMVDSPFGFAAGGHMVQNQKYWKAKECDKTPVGSVNKEKSHFSN